MNLGGIDGSYPQCAATKGEFSDAVRAFLKPVHIANSRRAIQHPSPDGVFPNQTLCRPVPFVLDANWLRNDVIYSCRNDRRTTLVNAANSGYLRIFSAGHVVNEIEEHRQEWCLEEGLPPGQFLDRWDSEYRPLIRVVATDGLYECLTPAEQRIDSLSSRDSDDVPSALLALVLGAPFVSGDGPALEAVYGRPLTHSELGGWLELERVAGDAGVLEFTVDVGTGLTCLVADGVRFALESVHRMLGHPGFLLLGAAVGTGISAIRPESWQRVGALAKESLLALACAQSLRNAVRNHTPDVPGWHGLARTVSPQACLLRACLHALARQPGHPSALQLADALPWIGVGQGVAKVRHTLRTGSCFHPVDRGRWQAGRALPGATQEVMT